MTMHTSTRTRRHRSDFATLGQIDSFCSQHSSQTAANLPQKNTTQLLSKRPSSSSSTSTTAASVVSGAPLKLHQNISSGSLGGSSSTTASAPASAPVSATTTTTPNSQLSEPSIDESRCNIPYADTQTVAHLLSQRPAYASPPPPPPSTAMPTHLMQDPMLRKKSDTNAIFTSISSVSNNSIHAASQSHSPSTAMLPVPATRNGEQDKTEFNSLTNFVSSPTSSASPASRIRGGMPIPTKSTTRGSPSSSVFKDESRQLHYTHSNLSGLDLNECASPAFRTISPTAQRSRSNITGACASPSQPTSNHYPYQRLYDRQQSHESPRQQKNQSFSSVSPPLIRVPPKRALTNIDGSVPNWTEEPRSAPAPFFETNKHKSRNVYTNKDGSHNKSPSINASKNGLNRLSWHRPEVTSIHGANMPRTDSCASDCVPLHHTPPPARTRSDGVIPRGHTVSNIGVYDKYDNPDDQPNSITLSYLPEHQTRPQHFVQNNYIPYHHNPQTNQPQHKQPQPNQHPRNDDVTVQHSSTNSKLQHHHRNHLHPDTKKQTPVHGNGRKSSHHQQKRTRTKRTSYLTKAFLRKNRNDEVLNPEPQPQQYKHYTQRDGFGIYEDERNAKADASHLNGHFHHERQGSNQQHMTGGLIYPNVDGAVATNDMDHGLCDNSNSDKSLLQPAYEYAVFTPFGRNTRILDTVVLFTNSLRAEVNDLIFLTGILRWRSAATTTNGSVSSKHLLTLSVLNYKKGKSHSNIEKDFEKWFIGFSQFADLVLYGMREYIIQCVTDLLSKRDVMLSRATANVETEDGVSRVEAWKKASYQLNQQIDYVSSSIIEIRSRILWLRRTRSPLVAQNVMTKHPGTKSNGTNNSSSNSNSNSNSENGWDSVSQSVLTKIVPQTLQLLDDIETSIEGVVFRNGNGNNSSKAMVELKKGLRKTSKDFAIMLLKEGGSSLLGWSVVTTLTRWIGERKRRNEYVRALSKAGRLSMFGRYRADQTHHDIIKVYEAMFEDFRRLNDDE